MEIRQTRYEDIPELLELFELGRLKQIETGNPNQWIKGYPSSDLLQQDIDSGGSYVCLDGEEIVGSFYLLIGEDPTYGYVEGGAWLNEDPYVTIHRFVTKYERRGIAASCINWVRAQYQNIKIDTHELNMPMRRLVEKMNFKYCGVIYLLNGDPRVAYQYSEEKD